MNRLLVAVLVLMLIALYIGVNAMGANESQSAVAKACEGKKAGVEVVVGGKKIVCPSEAKKKSSTTSYTKGG